jgi:hypothetical protein
MAMDKIFLFIPHLINLIFLKAKDMPSFSVPYLIHPHLLESEGHALTLYP